jgi:hypothetical protein
MTREAFEAALDQGQLWTRVGSRWYVCRRNGQTKVWKRDESRFEVPIKYRFRDAARVESRHFYSGFVDQYFTIATESPNAQAPAFSRAQS